MTPRDRRNMEFEDVEGAALTGIELPKIQLDSEPTQVDSAAKETTELKAQLKAAIEEENFEKAAELRDQIRQQEEKNKDEKTKE